MKINILQEDIDKPGNPIENAVKREYGLDCTVERKYIVFKGNESHPFRLSAQAEAVNQVVYSGMGEVEPFSFEIGWTH